MLYNHLLFIGLCFLITVVTFKWNYCDIVIWHTMSHPDYMYSSGGILILYFLLMEDLVVI